MPILDEFEKLCVRIVKAKEYFADMNNTQEQKEKQLDNLYRLSDEVDTLFMKMNEEERTQALDLLKATE